MQQGKATLRDLKYFGKAEPACQTRFIFFLSRFSDLVKVKDHVLKQCVDHAVPHCAFRSTDYILQWVIYCKNNSHRSCFEVHRAHYL